MTYGIADLLAKLQRAAMVLNALADTENTACASYQLQAAVLPAK